MGQIYSTPSSLRSEDDGSNRERVTSTISSNAPRNNGYYDVAPLLDTSTCPIMDLPINSLEKILSQISLIDLSQFSQTCHHFNMAVGEFLRHQCCAEEPLLKYQDFVNRLGQLATRPELCVLEDIKQSLSEDEREASSLSGAARYKLLHHCKMFEKMNCHRISVCDERVHFPHRGNLLYIRKDEDPTLRRQIASVREVCWLEIRHSFPVTPGTYSVSLRLRVSPRTFRWPHRNTDPTVFSINYPSASGQDSCSISVFKNWWTALKKPWTTPVPATDGISVTWEELRPGERTGWVSVTLDPVTVTEGELEFQMRDVECPWWKSGLLFDFIQVCKET